MKSTSKVSLKQIDRATYRATTTNGRSAVTGRFVSASATQRAPRGPVTEKRTSKD
jgi:hypothetical protein